MSVSGQNQIAQTLKAIEFIKTKFQKQLCKSLHLMRVSAPLFIDPKTGLNDDLNGIERKVEFTPAVMKGTGDHLEVVQSLAKWKRYVLWKYRLVDNGIDGIVADMNAIRQDERIDNLHSLYVDQWDWEAVIHPHLRTPHLLHAFVVLIFECIKNVDKQLSHLRPPLFEDNTEIFFITSDELYDKYPHLTSKERENAIAQEHKAVFIERIGGIMQTTNNDNNVKQSKRHDLRAPDYDDWNLNGDIIVWSPVLNSSIELSSMGIRVNAESLERQLKELNLYDERHDLPYHKLVLNNTLPQTIGGGIGQSRLCMFLLQKEHIAQVQSAYFPNLDEHIEGVL